MKRNYCKHPHRISRELKKREHCLQSLPSPKSSTMLFVGLKAVCFVIFLLVDFLCRCFCTCVMLFNACRTSEAVTCSVCDEKPIPCLI